MLHKLALVTTEDTPTIIKEALISMEEHNRLLAIDKQKALAQAEARNIKVPLKDVGTRDTRSRKPKVNRVPDIENTRLNDRAEPTQEKAKVKTRQNKSVIDPDTGRTKIDPKTGKAQLKHNPKGGKARVKVHQVPGASVPSTRQGSALIEKEIQKAHGTVSHSMPKQMKHTYFGGARRFWNGRNLLKNKWLNRGGAVAGVTALGLGVKAYLDSNKLREQEAAQPVEQPYTAEAGYADLPQQDPYYNQYEEYPKMGSDKYSPDAVTIPKPTPQPTVKALGPGVSSAPKLTGTATGGKGLLGGRGSSSSGTSSGGLGSSSSSSKQAEDAGVLALLGAAAGGGGGWAIGNKVMTPLLEHKQKILAAHIERAQAAEKVLKTVTKKAPMGAAAAGALLLAALAALYAKRGEKEKKSVQPVDPYDSTGAGFQQQGYNPYGNFYG